ncbi:hypothetical protein EVAR_61721_1 [Eumeta japonica]|uniref:Uncharacterized protein n=1 Tax=Eumeta variegata TaxID=151549 RepID=A0A4C1ZQW7_EUMVA|nr:hypothetical protein EVAR_61721_1 [Eumeta japonica]
MSLESATPHRTPLAVHAHTPHAAIMFSTRHSELAGDHKFTDESVCHSSSSRAYRAHLRITAGDGVLYAVHGVTSQISAVVNSVPIHLYGVTGAVCLLEVGPETTTAPATCSVTSRGRGAWCRRYVVGSRLRLSTLTVDLFSVWDQGSRLTWENREYICVMEDSGKGSRQATRDALLVAGGYSKCKYFNSVYLFGMKMNRWSEGPSVSQFRPYAGTALPL